MTPFIGHGSSSRSSAPTRGQSLPISWVLRATSRHRCASSRQKPGRELQVHGSGDLLRWLLERDLVDELNLEIHPVVVGDGLRLFPEHGQTHDLTLVESRSTPSGVTLQTYRPSGRATFATVGE